MITARSIRVGSPAASSLTAVSDDNNRIEIGPTQLAFDEWAAAGLEAPNLEKMRRFRLDRIIGQLKKHDYAGVLMFDPLNIRYATDSTNMQLWNTHNAFRACLVTADGYMVLLGLQELAFPCRLIIRWSRKSVQVQRCSISPPVTVPVMLHHALLRKFQASSPNAWAATAALLSIR